MKTLGFVGAGNSSRVVRASRFTRRNLRRAALAALSFVLAFSLSFPAPALAEGEDDASEVPPAAEATPVVGEALATEKAEEAPAAEVAEGAPAAEETGGLQAATPYKSDITDANMRQLVIVVRFAGDTVGDGDTGLNATQATGSTLWADKLEYLNGLAAVTYTSPTLYSYLKQVSLGKVMLETVSPQTDGATERVSYITLPEAKDAYANSDILARDAVEAFNEAYPDFDASVLDSDGDKYADNILIVPEANGVTPDLSSALWPKCSNIGSDVVLGSSGAVKASSYTLVDTTHLFVGTIVHETLHSFGAKDLYRAAGGVAETVDKPVGVWDIMAETSATKLMWPLAISRQDCGWTTIGEATQTTCTLYAPSSGKTQAVKIRTGLSSSEYFVAEYRKASKYTSTGDISSLDPSSEAPSTIGGSGLVVYRVNPAMRDMGNKGDKDYVYIFRDGETGGPRGDGVSTNLRNAQLSTTTRKTLGTADMAKGLTDGAIAYSSGQNSGLVITVVSETEDSITFDIKYPDIDGNDMWQEALSGSGDTPLASVAASSTKVDSDGSAVFQLCTDFFGKKATVLRYDGKAWASLGTLGSGCQEFDVACIGGSVYVCGVDFSQSKVTVWRWSGYGTTWSQVATLSAAANYAVLGDVSGVPYLFVAKSDKGGLLYRMEGNALKTVGSQLSSAQVNACAIMEVNGSPALAYSEFSQSNLSTKLAILSGSTWSSKVLIGENSTSLDAVSNGSANYLAAVHNSSLSVMRIDSKGAVASLVAPPASSSVMDASMTSIGSHVFAGVNRAGANDGGKVEVFQLAEGTASAWSKVGFDVISSASEVAMTSTTGELYCASSDSGTSRAALHRHSFESGGSALPAWKIATAPKAVNRVYSGRQQTGVSGGTGCTVQGGAATKVGTYTATVTPAAGYAWNAAGDRSAKRITWKILPAPSVAYSTHVQNIGWQKEVRDGARGGTAGRALRVEAFKVRLASQPHSGGIRMRAHVQNIGWQGWAYNGAVSGTSGRSLRVEAVKIELTGEMAKHYDVYYRAHVQNVGDTGWAKNGDPCGSAGYSYRMEALYVKLVPKGGKAPGSTAGAFVHPWVSYQTHVQNIGWQSSVFDGALGGTTGRSLRVEAFKVKLVEQPCSGGIEVSSHVQSIGWQGWRANGALSGTAGRSLRVEALKVRLTGEMGRRYDVYYRTHCQNVGWTGWAKNGNPSGTAGYSYRMEAVQIRLVPKGGAAPGSTTRSFYQR